MKIESYFNKFNVRFHHSTASECPSSHQGETFYFLGASLRSWLLLDTDLQKSFEIEKGILKCLENNSWNLQQFRKKFSLQLVVCDFKAKHIANEYAKLLKNCVMPVKVTSKQLIR